MSFLYPHILWFLFLPALLAGLVALARRKTGNGWLKLVSTEHTDELVTRRPAWRGIIPAALCILALACTIAALARPINGFREASGLSTGRNLLIALDISRSMETQDVKPSRLEEARAAAFELIDSLPSDKIGLIVFSGDADLVVPLTYDHTALRDALEQVNRDWAGTGGTNFGLVLKRAMQDLKRSAPDGTNALVLLSDGEDTVGSSLDIAEEARKDKLLVITVGVGSAAGGPIPDPKGQNGLWQDADGKHVISKLDATALRKFSEATGGDFAVLGSNTDLTAFTKNAVRKIDRHEENVSTNKVPNDLFAWFAWTALALLVVAIVVATEWRLPRRGAITIMIILQLMTPVTFAAPSAESVQKYTTGLELEGEDNPKALEVFSSVLLDEDPKIQAAAFYQIGNVSSQIAFDKLRKLYDNGEETSDQVLSDIDDDDTRQSRSQAPAEPPLEELKAIANALKNSIRSYESALKIDPSLNNASTNINRLQSFVEELDKEIQQQQNKLNQNDPNAKDKLNQNDPNAKDRLNQNDPNAKDKLEQRQNNISESTELEDSDKERQSAADILRMHLDEEKGSPIPHAPANTVRPPRKDY